MALTPITDGMSGLDARTNINASFTQVDANVVAIATKVTSGGALGTPSSGVLTNCTGTAAGLTAGSVTTNANLTGVVTSIGNATAIADAALGPAKITGTAAILGANTFTGVQSITNTAASTSSTTGALKVAGGLGVAGKGCFGSIGAANGTVVFDGNNFTATGGNAGFRSDATNTTLGNGVDQYVMTIRGASGLFMNSAASFGFTDSTSYSGILDTFIVRSAAAVLQLGLNAAGITNQRFKACDRITSDGVGASLTISGGNGRGGAGGDLILASYTTAGSGVAGTLTTRWMLDAATGALLPGATTNYNLGSSEAVLANVYSTDYYSGSTKVVGPQGSAVADASGGANIDAEARIALNDLLARLRTHGLIAT